jgi:hypothetical protein
VTEVATDDLAAADDLDGG